MTNMQALCNEYSTHNKHLIEEIKEKNKLLAKCRDGIEQLIQQVDHVEELEKDISNYKKACSAWEALESYGRKENQRYKQALEEIQFQTSISETSGGIFDIAMEALKEAESND